MSLYFFDIVGDDIEYLDDVGTELEAVADAKIAALELIPDLGSQSLLNRKDFTCSIYVRNSNRVTLMTATLFVECEEGIGQSRLMS